VERSTRGVGAATGATASLINRVAMESAAAGGVECVVGPLHGERVRRTGKVSSEVFGDLIGSARSYGRFIGVDLADANSDLAKAFADPVAGAQRLNERLGFLTGGPSRPFSGSTPWATGSGRNARSWRRSSRRSGKRRGHVVMGGRLGRVKEKPATPPTRSPARSRGRPCNRGRRTLSPDPRDSGASEPDYVEALRSRACD
jgi:hypothetical protein